jgi:RNA polymerase sigma factor (sigma-70 family)
MGVGRQSVDLARVRLVDDLLREARAGNPDAFARLYADHVHELRRYARRLAPAEFAEDLAAEAFTNTWAQIVAGRGPRRGFAAYLRAIVWNLYQAHVRREELMIWVADLADAVTGDALPRARWESLSPEHQLLARLLGDRVSETLGSLPRRWQEVLIAVYVESVPYKLACAQLNLSESGARQLARRARLHMRDRLADVSVEDFQLLDAGSYDVPYRQGAIGKGAQGRVRPIAKAAGADGNDPRHTA